MDTQELPGIFTGKGWQPPETGLTAEQAELLVQTFDNQATAHESSANFCLWALADLLVWSEDHLGDAFSQITPEPGRNRRSYTMLMRISRAFADHNRRRLDISVWAHSEVYELPEYIADELLEDYANGLMTRDQLRKEAQKLRDGVPVEDDILDTPAEAPETHEDGAGEPPPCPLCLGAGNVPEEEREAFVEFLAMRESVKW